MTSKNITLAEWLTNVTNGFDYLTTNGLVFPKLTIKTGQRKRFRSAKTKLINSSILVFHARGSHNDAFYSAKFFALQYMINFFPFSNFVAYIVL